MKKLFAKWFREPELSPAQVDESGHITDPKILNRDRLKFGIGCIMYQSEEVGLGPIHTLIVRLLGGGNVALSLVAGASCATSLVQWFGAVLLRRTGSNRKAMIWALAGGVLFGLILFAALWLKVIQPKWGLAAMTLYVIGSYGLAAASGMQNNIESSWIGDLVPLNRLGSFTSVKWVIGALGMLFFTIGFGQVAEKFPYLYAMAWLYLFVAFSHLAALVLIGTVTDRKPQTVKFVTTDSADRIDYRNKALWCYIWFYLTWAGGRTALVAFTAAYMMDYFKFGMGKITLLFALQSAVNLVMLLVVGKLSDKIGARKPLIVISGFVALCMLLWPASAWLGVTALIIYQVLNGMAGTTHNMLGINYSLEIFPAKGRAAYIGFARMFIGVSALVATVAAGYIMNWIGDWQMTLGGVTLNHYHLFFTGGTIFTASCISPLMICRGQAAEK